MLFGYQSSTQFLKYPKVQQLSVTHIVDGGVSTT